MSPLSQHLTKIPPLVLLTVIDPDSVKPTFCYSALKMEGGVHLYLLFWLFLGGVPLLHCAFNRLVFGLRQGCPHISILLYHVFCSLEHRILSCHWSDCCNDAQSSVKHWELTSSLPFLPLSSSFLLYSVLSCNTAAIRFLFGGRGGDI